ncbi:hypothetical protein ACWEN3_06285 [Streptomyces sp. NPDC004561]
MFTLGVGDLHLTEELVDALNGFLANRDDKALEVVLNRVPKAVRMATQQYLKEKCPPMPGAFTGFGPIDVVRPAVYFRDIDDELEEYLEAAYMIGLGIRMSNEQDSEGDVEWVVQLLSDEVSVPASAEPRTWELPAEAKLLQTWTSKQRTGPVGPVRGAFNVAEEASAQGHWVRIHTLLHSDRDVDFEGNGTSEFVVDVFDAPIALQRLEE